MTANINLFIKNKKNNTITLIIIVSLVLITSAMHPHEHKHLVTFTNIANMFNVNNNCGPKSVNFIYTFYHSSCPYICIFVFIRIMRIHDEYSTASTGKPTRPCRKYRDLFHMLSSVFTPELLFRIDESIIQICSKYVG